MNDLLLMFYLGGVTAGLGPAFGARDRVAIQILLTLGWPILGLGALVRVVKWNTRSGRS